MYPNNTERFVIGACIPNVQGDQVSVRFEHFHRLNAQTATLDHVFNEVKGAATGKNVDQVWRLARDGASEYGVVTEEQGASAIYYWYDLVEWCVDLDV